MTDELNPFLDPARARFAELMMEVEERQPSSEIALAPHRLAEPWGVDPWVSAMLGVDQELNRLRELAVGTQVEDPESAFVNVAVGAINARILYEEGEAAVSGVELDDAQMAVFLEKLAHDLGTRIENLRTPPKDVDAHLEDDRNQELDRGPGNSIRLDPDTTSPFDVLVNDDPHELHDQYKSLGRDPEQDNVEPVLERELPTDLPPEPTNGHPKVEGLPPEPVDLEGAERELARGLVDLRRTAGGSGYPLIGGAHQSQADTDPDVGETGRRARED